MSTLINESSLPNISFARLLARCVFPTPVDPKNTNEPMGLFGSLIPIRFLRIDFDILDTASSCPITFKFKDDVNAKEHYGFIAQEIEKLYPELVKNSEMGYKTVNYIELIPILVSKMQEMDKEIKELKEKLQ